MARAAESSTLKLPPSCTAAILEQVRNMPELQTWQPTPGAPLSISGEALADQPVAEEDVTEEYVEEEEEEDIPHWFTNPDFLSGNYGTPDLNLPVFREEDWVDMHEEYPQDDEGWGDVADYHYRNEEPKISSSASGPTASVTTTPRPKTITPGGVERYFGVKIRQ